MIIVTGASGQLGGTIVERLIERLPAGSVGVSVRDPDKVRALERRGVRVRQGDFTDPESLRHAFEGASQVLVVSAATTGEAAMALHRAAIEAAQDAGARRILYTSHMGADPASLFEPMPDHAATEDLLAASDTPCTALRNGFYAASGLQLMGRALETGALHAPEDGPVSWTDHADLAEAIAIILSEEGRFNGATPPLTAPEALDMADLAQIASELTGREIKRIVVSDDAYRASLVSHGVPEHTAELLVGLFRASRAGAFAAVDPTLGQLLGRPPLSMRTVLASRLPA